MIIRACAFTDKGFNVIKKLEDKMPQNLFEIRDKEEDLVEWTRESFLIHAPIVFVGATGIAVRSIAQFVEDKLTDSPVIVIDDNAKFVIPILSGHMGGANELAMIIAGLLNSTPVITTSTDVNGLFSVDVFAAKNGLKVINRNGIREVSAKLLKEKEITLAVEPGIDILPEALPKEVRVVRKTDFSNVDVYVTTGGINSENAILTLQAKMYVVGIGCKKNMDYDVINEMVQTVLSSNDLRMADISGISSIDLKERERGLLLLSSINHIPLKTFSADELNALVGEFSTSEFVQSVTGVSNVCERAAMALAGEGGEIIVPKQANNGVTVSVARRKVVLHG